MVVDTDGKKPTRVGYRVDDEGRRKTSACRASAPVRTSVMTATADATEASGAAAEDALPRARSRRRCSEEFGYANVMQIPGLVKIVVNMGVGEAARDSKLIDGAVRDLTTITGQKPQVTKARKSIAQFKLREGMPIGAKVTLRGDRMWEFLDRLLSLALPRIRDFRGLSPTAVRRQRQLHLRSHRAVDVPRDRPGQDRPRRAAWTSPWSPRPPPTTRAGRCCVRLGFPFKEN